MVVKWRKNGIPGWDDIIRLGGKLYQRSFNHNCGLGDRKAHYRKLKKKYPNSRIYRIYNTTSFAVYLPYSGSKRPRKRPE